MSPLESKFLPFDAHVKLDVINYSYVEGSEEDVLFGEPDDTSNVHEGEYVPRHHTLEVKPTEISADQDTKYNVHEETTL